MFKIHQRAIFNVTVFVSNLAVRERFGMYAYHVVLQLGGTAGANKYAGDAFLIQNPSKSHFCKSIVARGGDAVQPLEICDEFRR